MVNLDELGYEYGKLVIASELGLDLEGNELQPHERRTGQRQLEIEAIFKAHDNYTLDQYVNNLWESLEDTLGRKL